MVMSSGGAAAAGSPDDQCGDVRARAQRVLSERLPVGRDRAWGILSAVSDIARKRPQGCHILLNLEEHTLGRSVRDPSFLCESISISGRHCKIFRRNVADFAVFIKDTSSNGTFVNGQKLKKDSPELRLKHGDIVSLAAVPENETAFVFVYRDVPEGTSGGSKRKATLAALPEEDEENKRTRVLGGGIADGPVHLADVRRLERKNQELRQKLEEECHKSDTLGADLRASISLIDSKVKEARDQCKAEYSQKLADVQSELSIRTKELDECSAKFVQQQGMIDDLNKRLKAAAQSRVEAEEALQNHKVSRAELEKQLEEERNLWKSERDEAESLHKAALDRTRAEAAEDLNRQIETASRQQKQLEDQINALQETKREDRLQIDSIWARLEEERQSRMNFDKRAQELGIQLSSEQNLSATLRQELDKTEEKLQKTSKELDSSKAEKDAALARIKTMELEMEIAMGKLDLERRRLEGARERIVLRETQLRAFHSTAEEIASLQQKQQEQLKAMLKTLEDDDCDNHADEDLKSVHANGTIQTRGNDDYEASESKTLAHEAGMKDFAKQEGSNSENDTQEIAGAAEDEKTSVPTPTTIIDLNTAADLGEETSRLNETATAKAVEATLVLSLDNAQVLPTQVLPLDNAQELPTQVLPIDVQIDATQVFPMDVEYQLGHNITQPDLGGETMQLETQIVAEEQCPPGTPVLINNEDESDKNRMRRQSSCLPSMCTADLLTSEVAGSWAEDTPPDYHDDNECGEVCIEQENQTDFVVSQVATSDSEQVRTSPLRGENVIPRNRQAEELANTLGSQTSPKPPNNRDNELLETAMGSQNNPNIDRQNELNEMINIVHPQFGRHAPDAGINAPDYGRNAPDSGRNAPDSGRIAPDAARNAPDSEDDTEEGNN